MILNWITMLSWIVGPVGTMAVLYLMWKGEQVGCPQLVVILSADAWLLARYLM